jgi:hypothetical protein
MAENEIRIGHSDNDFVLIRIFGREVSAYLDYWDSNWLNAEVVISAGRFRGELRGTFHVEDFVSFRDELMIQYRDLTTTVSFATMESWLSLQIKGDGLGHLVVEGEAEELFASRNKLLFKIEFDQTFVPDILKALDRIIEAFPIIGG